ncbi:MAG TPA: hypothetical protein VE093_33025 [Polyangiaceae bacterium]|jgi:hypothetical protein|nr:hypothetical protein [Polyangiaceae bacterium]
MNEAPGIHSEAAKESAAEVASPHDSRAPAQPMLILRLVRPLAVVGVLALILGRLLGPSWAGIAVGMGRLTRLMEVAGGALTQLFAMAATVLTMAELLTLTKSRASYLVRILAIVAGGLAIIVSLSAAAVRVPALSLGLVGVTSSALAVASAWDAVRAPFARRAALVLGLVGAAGLVRLAGIGIAVLAASRISAPLTSAARIVATVSFVVEAVALLVAMAVLATGSKKVTSPLTTAALVLAFLATRQAMVGGADDADLVSVLLRRAATRLLTRPEPFIPLQVQFFTGFLAVFAAASALFSRGQVPALAGALALALVARGSPDMPLGALVLVVASMSVVLAAQDDRGLWAAISTEQGRPGEG